MVKAQEFIDNKYKKNISYINVGEQINDEKLEGKLDLSEFTKLKWLSISKNELTSLTLGNNNELETINLSENKIKDLSWLGTLSNKENLKKINLFGNEISNIDFSLLTSFPNLKSINLGNNPLDDLDLGDLDDQQSSLLKKWVEEKKINITSWKGNLTLNLLKQFIELREENKRLRNQLNQQGQQALVIQTFPTKK